MSGQFCLLQYRQNNPSASVYGDPTLDRRNSDGSKFKEAYVEVVFVLFFIFTESNVK